MPYIVKDHSGQFLIYQEDGNGRTYFKPFRLLSNTASTDMEWDAYQREVMIPNPAAPGQPVQAKDEKPLVKSEPE